MSENSEVEELKTAAIKFDLANLELELNGLLAILKGNSAALRQFHAILSKAMDACAQAIAEADKHDAEK